MISQWALPECSFPSAISNSDIQDLFYGMAELANRRVPEELPATCDGSGEIDVIAVAG